MALIQKGGEGTGIIMTNLKRYLLLIKLFTKWFFKNVVNFFVVVYCLIRGKHSQRRSIFYRELISVQNVLSYTNSYWRILDKKYSANIEIYRKYVEANSYDIVYKRQVELLKAVDRVIQKKSFDSIVGDEKDSELTWVMSTGRCGVDALDRYFKLSKDHFSIHREFFKDEMYYAYKSTLTTKSYVFHKFFYNNASDAEIESIIETFLCKRIKTIRRREGKKWVFCEHCDTVWLPIILRIFPSSKIVFLSKNPKEVIRSYMSKQQYSSAQEMPLSPSQDKLMFKTLFGLMCWFYTYISMYISIHCELIGNDQRILRVNGEDLLEADLGTYKKLNEFLGMSISQKQFREHFGGRYNSKSHRSKYSGFPEIEKWPDSYLALLELFSTQIDHKIDISPRANACAMSPGNQ